MATWPVGNVNKKVNKAVVEGIVLWNLGSARNGWDGG